ncbi:hypothetical protein EVAR_53553_1 [Eumeta japonica]|uniref:Uncharacterized protein n=1 Tax=Eumeta variegata TaxID=151549 RepID=A0A4C1YPL6_EUMVA|nr:hypothetical protein EVAR_53553_1 [Eumeta japonica]
MNCIDRRADAIVLSSVHRRVRIEHGRGACPPHPRHGAMLRVLAYRRSAPRPRRVYGRRAKCPRTCYVCALRFYVHTYRQHEFSSGAMFTRAKQSRLRYTPRDSEITLIRRRRAGAGGLDSKPVDLKGRAPAVG